MPRPLEKVTTIGHQPPSRMTIAFLLDAQNEAGSTDARATRDYCDAVSRPSQVPVAHSSPCIPLCDQTEMPKKLLARHPLQTDFSHQSNGQFLPQVRSVEKVDRTLSSSSSRASSSGTESCGYDSSNPSSDLLTGFYGHHGSHHHHRCYDHPAQSYKSTGISAQDPRSTGPSYDEEQKFFIMHHRVVKQLSWPEIENEFAKFFKLRTKGGLTSVYYRIRRSWGMEQVLKNQDRRGDDFGTIQKQAKYFSRAFLEKIGYFD